MPVRRRVTVSAVAWTRHLVWGRLDTSLSLESSGLVTLSGAVWSRHCLGSRLGTSLSLESSGLVTLSGAVCSRHPVWGRLVLTVPYDARKLLDASVARYGPGYGSVLCSGPAATRLRWWCSEVWGLTLPAFRTRLCDASAGSQNRRAVDSPDVLKHPLKTSTTQKSGQASAARGRDLAGRSVGGGGCVMFESSDQWGCKNISKPVTGSVFALQRKT